MRTFMDAVRSGAASPDDVDDWVAAWHTGGGSVSLDAWLGLTADQGAHWAETGELPASS